MHASHSQQNEMKKTIIGWRWYSS